jgi:hypothetical protein
VGAIALVGETLGQKKNVRMVRTSGDAVVVAKKARSRLRQRLVDWLPFVVARSPALKNKRQSAEKLPKKNLQTHGVSHGDKKMTRLNKQQREKSWDRLSNFSGGLK